MAFKLPKLPYDTKALEPHMSQRTLELHHGKHHAAYVKKLNELVADTSLTELPLEGVIAATANRPDRMKIFNNAAQCWNHEFFWKCLSPDGGGKPKGTLSARLESDFGGYDKFADAFASAAEEQFGSGWAWLIADDHGKLSILPTSNADLPLAHARHALLCVDVWEHAYYVDYQNKRDKFVSTFLEALLNWDFAEANYRKLSSLRAAA